LTVNPKRQRRCGARKFEQEEEEKKKKKKKKKEEKEEEEERQRQQQKKTSHRQLGPLRVRYGKGLKVRTLDIPVAPLRESSLRSAQVLHVFSGDFTVLPTHPHVQSFAFPAIAGTR